MAKKVSPKKSSTKKTVANKAGATKKSAAKKAAKKTSATKAATKKSAAKKTAAKKTPAKKAGATKKSAAKKAPAKSAPQKKAEAKKPVASKFDKKFLDEQKGLLLEERARYTRSADNLQAEADSLVESREPGDVQFDEESGDGNNLAVERDRSLALSASARLSVQAIDDALERIEAGTYGMCSHSGKPIPKERLRAIPWASERVEYKVGGLRR